MNRMGYGAMQLAGLGDQGAPDPDAAVAVLRRAVARGVNHIDTAEFYGDGVANDRIRSRRVSGAGLCAPGLEGPRPRATHRCRARWRSDRGSW